MGRKGISLRLSFCIPLHTAIRIDYPFFILEPYAVEVKEVFFMKSHKRLRLVCFSAVLIAIEVVLNRFFSINTLGLKIGFSFVPIVIAAMLFGAVRAGIIYGVSDIIGAILFPIGPYCPGFTVSAVLMGSIYGLFLYKKQRVGFFKNILPPVLINNLVFGLIINTAWVSLLYSSKSYWGWFIYRLPEYAVLIPVSLVLIPAICRLSKVLNKIVNK